MELDADSDDDNELRADDGAFDEYFEASQIPPWYSQLPENFSDDEIDGPPMDDAIDDADPQIEIQSQSALREEQRGLHRALSDVNTNTRRHSDNGKSSSNSSIRSSSVASSCASTSTRVSNSNLAPGPVHYRSGKLRANSAARDSYPELRPSSATTSRTLSRSSSLSSQVFSRAGTPDASTLKYENARLRKQVLEYATKCMKLEGALGALK